MRPAVLHPYRPTDTSGEGTLLARLLGMTQVSLPVGENLANTRYRARARGVGAEILFFLHMVTKDIKAHLLMWHCGERV